MRLCAQRLSEPYSHYIRCRRTRARAIRLPPQPRGGQASDDKSMIILRDALRERESGMKSRGYLAGWVVALVLVPSVAAQEVNGFCRFWGFGWSDGYHAPFACGGDCHGNGSFTGERAGGQQSWAPLSGSFGPAQPAPVWRNAGWQAPVIWTPWRPDTGNRPMPVRSPQPTITVPRPVPMPFAPAHPSVLVR